MPRSLRSKATPNKLGNDDKVRLHDDGKVHNGGVSTPQKQQSLGDPRESPAVSKRQFTNDSETHSLSPPSKKRHTSESATCKRARGNSDEESVERESVAKKVRRVDRVAYQRAWTSVADRDEDAETNNRSIDHHNRSIGLQDDFVVASYNVASAIVADSPNYRSLIDEVTFINADILCLQNVSVNHWHSLQEALTNCGYRGKITACGGSSGLATLYRASRFIHVIEDSDKLSKLCLEHIIRENSLEDTTLASIKEYIDEPEPYIVTVLKDIKNNRLLLVGNTHLCNDNVNKSDLKCVQAVAIFWHIHNIICKLKSDYSNNNSHLTNDTPTNEDTMSVPCWILCGDFNGSIDSPVYQICLDGYPNEASIEALQSVKSLVVADHAQLSPLINLIWHSFQHPFSDSKNSYCRGGNSSSDYIWMSDRALNTNKVLISSAAPGCGKTVTGDINNDHMFLACEVNFVT